MKCLRYGAGSLRHAQGLVYIVATGFLAVFLTRCGACTPKTVHNLAREHNDIGIQYLKQGQCLEAEERCRLALEYAPNFEHPRNCLGMVALTCRNDVKQAMQFFKDALSVNPDFAEAHNNLGACFARFDPPDYDAACDEFRAALEIDPGYLDGRENLGWCLMRKGTIAGDRGESDVRDAYYQEARSQLVRLLEQNPSNFNARHHLGFMDQVENKLESAILNFKRCLEIDPENAVCCYNLGETYLMAALCTEAIPEFICALRAGAQSEVSIGAREGLAKAYEKCARNDGAIQQFLERIKNDPANPAHHFDLGKMYSDKGLTDQAVNEWENATKLDPMYCKAYYELSVVANRNLDSAVTIRRCQDFVACVTERSRTEPVDAYVERVEQCKALVRKLEME